MHLLHGGKICDYIMDKIPMSYINRIQERLFLRYFIGLLIRIKRYVRTWLICEYARSRGAVVGKNSIIPFKLAKKANDNLIIGNDVIIETDDIDLRSKVIISDNVIINRGVTIIRVSHFIDNCLTYDTKYYSDLVIEEYCWLATNSVVLPSVKILKKGTVLGAFSVLSKDSDNMGVYSGNPAVKMREHNSVFSDLVVSSLVGGDLLYYLAARKV